jgi:hypothetical protein
MVYSDLSFSSNVLRFAAFCYTQVADFAGNRTRHVHLRHREADA